MCRVIVAKDILSEEHYFVSIDSVMHYHAFGTLEQMYGITGPIGGPVIPMREWPDGLKQNIVKRMEEMKNENRRNR